MKKQTALTPEQLAAIPAHVEKWIAKGLSTEPADFERATEAVLRCYDIAGLPRPKIVLRMGSPYGAVLGGYLAHALCDFEAVRKGGQRVMSRVEELALLQVQQDVWRQVGWQVWQQAGQQVWQPVGSQIEDQIGKHVEKQVGRQVTGQVSLETTEQADDLAEDLIAQHVVQQVDEHVKQHVEKHVLDQIGQLVWQQVWQQNEQQVWDKVSLDASEQAQEKIEKQQDMQHIDRRVKQSVWKQVKKQVERRIRERVQKQADQQIRRQVGRRTREQVRGLIRQEVWRQADQTIWWQVRDQVAEQILRQADLREIAKRYGLSVYDCRSGNLWAGWHAFITFLGEQGLIDTETPAYQSYLADRELAESCGLVWFSHNVVAISDRPEILRRDEQGQLHCENGPALAYRDGWALYCWHGVILPAHWVEQRDTVDPAEILAERDVEKRAAGAACVGWERMLSALDYRVIDSDPDPMHGELIEISGEKLGLPEPGRFLKAECPRNGTICEGVPLHINTVLEAQAWRVGLTPAEFTYPAVRT